MTFAEDYPETETFVSEMELNDTAQTAQLCSR